MTRLLLVLCAVVGLGVGLVATSLPRVDATRAPRALENAHVFVPDADALRAASSGFEEPVADLLWVRAALEFGRDFDRRRLAALRGWFNGNVDTVIALDPRWRTPYYYGGTLARANDDIPASNRYFELGHAQMPTDWFFPASRGMNAGVYEQDAAVAARWMTLASRLPRAPFWFKADAAASRVRAGAFDNGIRMLEESLAQESDPWVRRDIAHMLGKMRHNALVASWEGACKAWKADHGRLPAPEALARLGFTLPENPREDAWVVGSDGVVRSERSEGERVRRLRIEERAWISP
jgi:hypothetical protein